MNHIKEIIFSNKFYDLENFALMHYLDSKNVLNLHKKF